MDAGPGSPLSLRTTVMALTPPGLSKRHGTAMQVWRVRATVAWLSKKTNAQRLPIQPILTAVAKLGLPGFEALIWLDLLTPADIPTDRASGPSR